MKNREKINILVTVDENYVPHLNTMLVSLLDSNPDCWFDVYLIHSSVRESAVKETVEILDGSGELISIAVNDMGLDNAPTTERYPREIYYRIFASKYLPSELDRVLYLDPDIIVNGSISELYNMPLDEYYFAAASHTGEFLRKFNEIRLNMEDESPYINSGVMLMNLELLREEQDFQDVFDFVEKHKNHLFLPDQDIISSLYGSKIYPLDTLKYNMTERLLRKQSMLEKDFNLEWVRENSIIIHYIGKNKPWKDDYKGKLNVFYKETVERMR